jgi:hypothetical protein
LKIVLIPGAASPKELACYQGSLRKKQSDTEKIGLQLLMSEPNPADPLMMEIAYEFKHNREKVTPCLIFMNIENEKFFI